MAGMGPGRRGKGSLRFEHFRLNPEDSRRKQPEDGGDCAGLSRERHRCKLPGCLQPVRGICAAGPCILEHCGTPGRDMGLGPMGTARIEAP